MMRLVLEREKSETTKACKVCCATVVHASRCTLYVERQKKEDLLDAETSGYVN
jgi:hypothetical protein